MQVSRAVGQKQEQEGNLRGPYSSIQGGGGVLPPYMVGSSCPVPQDSV